MKLFYHLLLVFALIFGGLVTNLSAGNRDPLFINLTTDDPHRAYMGISFGANQLDRGHPLTIFFNDKGVLIGSKLNSDKFLQHQKTISEIIGKGATILICPMCIKHYGVNESDIIEGIKVSNPDITGSALFKDNTKTLTW